MLYYNRYTQVIESESTPGHRLLKYLYGNALGRLILRLFLIKPITSRCIGWWMSTRRSKKHIVPFAKRYHIDLNAFEKAPKAYTHFNDFFCRKFKPGQRPIDSTPNTLCFPCDGRHLGFQTLADAQCFFIKGTSFSLKQLLQDNTLAQHFHQGSCVISRLAPIDYHRFHFPCDGIPQAPKTIQGLLYSVHPTALQHNWRIFAENKRCLTVMQTQPYGLIAMIEVGACCIGSLQETFQPNRPYRKGDEKGYFAFGGSTIILLFESQRVQLAPDLINCTQHGLELYAHMGDILGSAIKNL